MRLVRMAKGWGHHQGAEEPHNHSTQHRLEVAVGARGAKACAGKATAVFIVLLSGLVPSFALSEETTSTLLPDQSALVELYLEVAFGSEFALVGEAGSPFIKKREQAVPVNIITLPQPSVPLNEAFDLVREVSVSIADRTPQIPLRTFDPEDLVELMQRDPSDIEKVFSDSIQIHIGNRKEIEGILEEKYSGHSGIIEVYERADRGRRQGDPLCFFVSFGKQKNKYEIGVSIIWIEYGPRVTECVYEEVLQSFGLPGDFGANTPSLFNDYGNYELPTELDWALWRIHSDSRIKAGMTAPEAALAAREIIAEGN